MTTSTPPRRPRHGRRPRRTRRAESAYRIRHHALNMGEVQGQGYVGQALGAADMLAAVYADQLRYRAEDPHWERPRPVPALHRPLRDRPLRRPRRGRHHPASRNWRPTAPTTPGCRCPACPPTPPAWRSPAAPSATDSPSPSGMALGLRYQGSAARVFNFLSDGELDEGSTWEAAMGAAHHQLGNLTAMVDINALQADGETDTRAAHRTRHRKVGGLRLVHPARRRQRRRRAARTRSTTPPPRPPPPDDPPSILCDTKVGTRRAAAGEPGEGALHAHRRTRMADLPRTTHRRLRTERTPA